MTPSITVHQRNWSLALLFVAGALNLFDRQIVNILAQSIKTELKISDAGLGLLTGTAFGLFYSVLGIPLGRLADRIDRVRLMAAVIALWSAFTALCGSAGGFTQLFILRMGVGVGEAGSQPASTALIADLFPPAQRTSAMSVLLVGAPVGSFLGLLVGGYVGALWGWRAAIVVAGIPGLLVAVIMLATMRDPRSAQLRRGRGAPLLSTLRMLARRPRFVWLAIGLTCASFFIYASGAWLPAYFIRVYAMSTARIGAFAALAVGLGGAIGTLGSGILCDALRARQCEAKLKVLAAALALSFLALLFTLFGSHRSIALTSMFVFNVFAYAFLGPTVTLIQEEAPMATRALAIAACVALSNIVNLGFALYLIGRLSDALTPQYGPRSIGYALALGATVALLVGTFAHWRARGASAADGS